MFHKLLVATPFSRPQILREATEAGIPSAIQAEVCVSCCGERSHMPQVWAAVLGVCERQGAPQLLYNSLSDMYGTPSCIGATPLQPMFWLSI